MAAIDPCLMAILACYLALWAPLLSRSCANPAYLACFNDDEPLITQQLVGMTVKPYGNPANYLQHPERRAKYWGKLAWPGQLYYGGTYLDLGFAILAPLKAVGATDFPASPIILRGISLLSGVLALMLVYGLGCRLGSRWIGTSAALLLMGQNWFCWYCAIIHPDMLLTALGLLALWIAVAYVERPALSSLLAFAIVVGLAQGTKCGGPWLIPLGVVAVAWGQLRLEVGWRRLLWRIPALLTLVGIVAILAFALSTPYAFVDSYYFGALRHAFEYNRTKPYGDHFLHEWVIGYWQSEGVVVGGLTLAALAAVGLQCFRRNVPIVPALAVILNLSVFIWYATTVRYLVQVNYLLPCFALSGLLIAWFVSRPLLWIERKGRWWARVAHVTAAALVVLIVGTRYQVPLLHALSEACRAHNTSVAVGRWAEANLPRESKIIYYGMAYFDPTALPNASWGSNGCVYYEPFEKECPDYFVLDGGFCNAPNIAGLRKTQKYSRGHEGPDSVLFLQNVLDRGSPEAEEVALIRPTFPGSSSTNDCILRLARIAFGLDDYILGHEKRVFRYHPEAKPSANERSLMTSGPQD